MSPKCIFVDDDRNLLLALERQLEDSFDISIFTSADRALTAIDEGLDAAVVVTDFKMPNINGVEFLRRLTTKLPAVVPMMLTGVGDLRLAKEALNQAGVFRFLTKPCSAIELTKALSEAVAKHEKAKAERELLEGTLSGTVKVLTDIIKAVDPVGFEEGQLIRKEIREIAQLTGIRETWEVELAAMLLNLGTLVLPTHILVKLRTQQDLSEAERKAYARIPEIGARLVAQVPRLERVAAIIRHQRVGSALDSLPENEIPLASKLLEILKDVAQFRARGHTAFGAMLELEQSSASYDPSLFKVIKSYYARLDEQPTESVRVRTQVEDLKPQQKAASDIVTKDGTLLVKAGTILDDTLIERVRNYSHFVGLAAVPIIDVPADSAESLNNLH